MKNFFESGFLMSHEGSFPMGVKLSKSKKVYPKCVVAQRLGLLSYIYFLQKHHQEASETDKIQCVAPSAVTRISILIDKLNRSKHVHRVLQNILQRSLNYYTPLVHKPNQSWGNLTQQNTPLKYCHTLEQRVC